MVLDLTQFIEPSEELSRELLSEAAQFFKDLSENAELSGNELLTENLTTEQVWQLLDMYNAELNDKLDLSALIAEDGDDAGSMVSDSEGESEEPSSGEEDNEEED